VFASGIFVAALALSPLSVQPNSAPAPTDATILAYVETIAAGHGKEYLDARRALVARPDQAITALVDALAQLDASGIDPQQKAVRRARYVAVLDELQANAPAAMIADNLRAVWSQLDADADFTCSRDNAGVAVWCAMARRQGAAAFASMIGLVGDRSLPANARQAALQLALEIASDEDAVQLSHELAAGDPSLVATMALALKSRAEKSAEFAALLRKQLDDQPWSRTRMIPLRLRWQIREEAETAALLAALVANASQPDLKLGRVLGIIAFLGEASHQAEVADALHRILLFHLDAAQTSDRSEAVVLAAFEHLDAAQKTKFASHPSFRSLNRPRLHAKFVHYGDLTQAPIDLESELQDPWPAVQLAALGRLSAPCDPKLRAPILQRLKNRQPGLRPDEVDSLAIASVDSLARCKMLSENEFAAIAADANVWDFARVQVMTHVSITNPQLAEKLLTKWEQSEPTLLEVWSSEALGETKLAKEVRRAICSATQPRGSLKTWLLELGRCPHETGEAPTKS
jgi:hypothetical protein